ncbi:MAG: hypothetical protein JSR34_01625 [Proteobacteria bacterium]|nr:hypothetical protein [Pseudomonadota bacterium]
MIGKLSIRRIALSLLPTLAAIYVLLCGLMYVLQGSVLYHPRPLRFEPDGQPLTIAGATGVLHGWVADPQHADAVVYFGGNGEPVERDVAIFRAMLPDRAVYLVPYRGYGPNAGTPSEAGIEADALKVFDYAQARHTRVAVIGRSLGTGVATFVAARRKVERLVLVTPYDSILNIARERYGMFPVGWLLRDRYESWRNADAVRAPTLVLLAEDDQVIPRRRSDALIAHLHPTPTVVVIEDAGHNNLSNNPRYADAIRSFLGDAVTPVLTQQTDATMLSTSPPSSHPVPSR